MKDFVDNQHGKLRLFHTPTPTPVVKDFVDDQHGKLRLFHTPKFTIAEENTSEIHFPGYNYMGPGTHVLERIKNGISPVNSLDMVAKKHDIEYATGTDPITADIRAIARTMPISNIDKIFMLIGLGARTYGDYELRKANIGINPLKDLANRTDYTPLHKKELTAYNDDYLTIDGHF